MKCNQCSNGATDGGSELCKACEDKVVEEYHRQQEQNMNDYLYELKNSLY